MKQKSIVALFLCAIALGGCYSSARHVANVRPDMIRPDTTLATKYKLERIVLRKSSFSRKVASGSADIDRKQRALNEKKRRLLSIPISTVDDYMEYLAALSPDYLAPGSKMYTDMKNRLELMSLSEQQKILAAANKSRASLASLDSSYEQTVIDAERKKYLDMVEEDKKSGPNGTHFADTQIIFNSVRSALVRNYSSVFADTTDAAPIAVVIDWDTEYKSLPNYASIFSGWLWPEAAEQETVYRLLVVENPGGRSDDALWQLYRSSLGKYPHPPECGSAVRTSEVWESALLLPTGFIPCPGESDFPKTFCFMRSSKDSLVSAPATKIESRDCFRHLVFEPKVDGDVLAAAIMRTVNRKHRLEEVARMMKKGGGK